ncbi:MAG: lipoprotein [Cohaesibacter sp.]|nr:lipoprotein [Cohaesibacter sp.]MCV6603110.1 lipoprotein [Cohaesibacter sp.]
MALFFVSSKRLTFMLVAALGLLVSACGQKGPLVAPTSNATAQTQPLDGEAASGQRVEPAPAKAPDKSFILDSLL